VRRCCRGWLGTALAILLLPVAPGRAALKVERDVPYGQAGGQRLLLDIYLPEGAPPRPAVLVVHGGGWMGGSKEGHRATGEMLAAAGYAAFVINYRLAPQFGYPAAVHDCQRAVRWIRANAAKYRVDPKRVGALGDSAGGHLVSLLGALRETLENSDPSLEEYSSGVQAVVNYYGPCELVRMWAVEPARRPLTAWLGGEPAGREHLYAAASPLQKVHRRAPPFLIIHGTRDEVVPLEQARLLHEGLRRLKASSTLLVLEGAGHGWPRDSDHARAGDAAVLEFFGRQLKR